MTTALLWSVAVLAGAILVGVLWSIASQIRAESASTKLRTNGVRTTGTVVDNTMTSTPQRQMLFSPVVEYDTLSGTRVLAAAQQRSATSWPRGSVVEVAYDPDEPGRFVMAVKQPSGHHAVANAVIALLVVAVMVGTMMVMYLFWWEFRYDRAGTAPAVQQESSDAAR